jgi:hypothetical protein
MEFHTVLVMNLLGTVSFLNLVIRPRLLLMSSAAKEFLFKSRPLSARFLHTGIGGTALFGSHFFCRRFTTTLSSTSRLALGGTELGLLA